MFNSNAVLLVITECSVKWKIMKNGQYLFLPLIFGHSFRLFATNVFCTFGKLKTREIYGEYVVRDNVQNIQSRASVTIFGT